MVRAEGVLVSHVIFGLLGTLAGMWVFVELLNARDQNRRRMLRASIWCAVLMWLSFFTGGYWYVFLYPADRTVILDGPRPWAHAIYMEAKEHIFFVLLLLTTYLPILAADRHLLGNRDLRKLGLFTAASIVVLGLIMAQFGGIVAMGLRLGLAR